MLCWYTTRAMWPVQFVIWKDISKSNVEVQDVDICFHLPYADEVMDEVVPWRVAREEKPTSLQILNKALTKPYVVKVLAFKVFFNCVAWLLWLVFVAKLIPSCPLQPRWFSYLEWERECHLDHVCHQSIAPPLYVKTLWSLLVFVDLEMEGESMTKGIMTTLLHMYIY